MVSTEPLLNENEKRMGDSWIMKSDCEFWLRAKFVKKKPKFYDTKRICALPFPIVEDSVQILLHSVVKKTAEA